MPQPVPFSGAAISQLQIPLLHYATLQSIKIRNPRAVARAEPPLRHVSVADSSPEEGSWPPSANAVAAAIRRASAASPVEFVKRIQEGGKNGLVLPSPDFKRLCVEQLDLFRMVVDRDAVLSVYVRPAGSYVMDQLELRRVVFYPGVDKAEDAECVILIGNFTMAAGLRAAEASLSNQKVEVIPECGAIVLPMVKHPFVVGFLVAELPAMEFSTCSGEEYDERSFSFSSSPDESYVLPSQPNTRLWDIQDFNDKLVKKYHQFTAVQRDRASMISRSLAVAYVMDQKTLLLQQTSWQNNIRMSHLVEQIRGSLSNIRTLSNMLSIHLKKTEIPYDIIEDILVQGDHMKDTLQQLQDAVYLTKANIVRYNEVTLKKMHELSYDHPDSHRPLLSDNCSEVTTDGRAGKMDPVFGTKDIEIPMPPFTLAPQQQNLRPCSVSDIVADLVDAAGPLAEKQQRMLELIEHSKPLQVAVEESALRQALSNLIEGALLRTPVGGRVEIVVTGAPAGGALIVIDDNGPDMQYMTQMHSLTPFGEDLFSDGMLADNMTWNFIAGLTVSREILESYGCVVRVISPCTPDAVLGVGGTRIEIWLPTLDLIKIESPQ